MCFISTDACCYRQKCGGTILTFYKFKFSDFISSEEPTWLRLSFASVANALMMFALHLHWTFAVFSLFLFLLLMSDSLLQNDFTLCIYNILFYLY